VNFRQKEVKCRYSGARIEKEMQSTQCLFYSQKKVILFDPQKEIFGLIVENL